MLNWSALSYGQRAMGVALALMFAVAGVFTFLEATLPTEFLGVAGLVMIGAGSVLNPVFYRPGKMRLADFPRICLWLSYGGLGLSVASSMFGRSPL